MRLGSILLTSVVLVAGLAPLGAVAQTAIGGAETVERDVSGELAGRNRPVGAGDQVFANEAIITAEQSAASLRFLDDTALAIGPQARVILDRFVYNADQTARRSVVSAFKGALRWTSGRSRASAYQVRTPLAAIGVRGTQFDLLVEDGQETVILRDGRVRVCLAGTSECKGLNNPGDVALITPGAISVAPRNAPSPSEFAQGCLSGAEAGCTISPSGPSIVQFASIPAAPVFGFTGFRIGISGIYTHSSQRTTWDGSPSVQQSIGLGNVPRSQFSSGDSFDVSVDAGYDFQSGPIVFGLEGEFAMNPFHCGSSDIDNARFGGASIMTATKVVVTSAASIKGRLGFAVTDKLLAYGVGGVTIGFTDESYQVVNNLPNTGQLYVARGNRTRVGYVIGAGAEYRITPMISAKIEYSHFDLGASSTTIAESARGTGGVSGQFAIPSTRIRGDVFKTGINLRF